MRPVFEHTRWHLYRDAAALTARATRIILRAAEEAIRTRGYFSLVLSGGTTPRAVYERLAKAAADWGAWRIYFGDERCLPPEHPERNSRMAADTWLDHVAIPRDCIHIMQAELGPDAAAAAYISLVEKALPFDLVLLGLGEDGHTASLFPGHQYPEARAVPVRNAPKPPPERVSLSARTLSDAHQAFFIVSGSGKRDAVAAWQAGEPIPAAGIAPDNGVDVLLDWSAWPAPSAKLGV